MNSVMNEYLHARHTCWNGDGLLRVIYEPPDNRPATGLAGTIYLDNNSFVCNLWTEGGQVVVLNGKPPTPISGFYLEGTGTLILYWSGDPGEHFICVSYEYEDWPPALAGSVGKTNWLQEGF